MITGERGNIDPYGKKVNTKEVWEGRSGICICLRRIKSVVVGGEGAENSGRKNGKKKEKISWG